MTSLATPIEHRVLNAIRQHIQPWIAEGIGSQFAHGATVEDVQRQLTAALGQIGRVNKFCAQREEA
jgi:hypothetical protein